MVSVQTYISTPMLDKQDKAAGAKSSMRRTVVSKIDQIAPTGCVLT